MYNKKIIRTLKESVFFEIGFNSYELLTGNDSIEIFGNIGGRVLRLTNLEVYNYRGIRECCISFPMNTHLVCLIGAGDSTKTTLLNAIEWLFWPSWSLNVTDLDYYQGNISQPIIIRGTFTELPPKLLAEDKYGLYLRRPGVSLQVGEDDEPNELLPYCLTIQLTIDSTLEPSWEIVCNRKEPKVISHNDRRLLHVSVIGVNVSKDLSWGKNSILQQYADSRGVLHDAYTAAVRNVVKNADFSALDDISTTLCDIGKRYGVDFASKIENRLMMQPNSISAAVGLFDGEYPLSQLGVGSQRLLSMGLNIKAASGDALLLIDEIETGLEPYRIRNIINEFKSNQCAPGQIIMTTHSPVVTAECSINELMIIHSVSGKTDGYYLKSEEQDVNASIQKQVRHNTEAFLSKRLVICEGKTEMGFMRALDRFLNAREKYRMAYKGISTADGNGSEIFKCSDVLIKCGYDICILMDSDKDSEDPEKQRLRDAGIPVFDWDKPNALEEQCFSEMPMKAIQEALDIVIYDKSVEAVDAKLKNSSIPYVRNEDTIVLAELSMEHRQELGKIAKDNNWYKTIGLGEQFGTVLLNHWDKLSPESFLKTVVTKLIEWVRQDESTGA